MRKEVIYTLFLIIISIEVLAIGVSPASISLDFEPNLRKNLTFYASHSEDYATNVTFYVKGGLSKYAKLDKTSAYLEESGFVPVIVHLVLPRVVEKPGENLIVLGVKDNPSIRPESTISATLGVEALIKILVPYPGKYAEIRVEADNADLGQLANIRVYLKNLGKELISIVSGDIIINNEEGKEVTKIKINSRSIKPGDEIVMRGSMKTENLYAGVYRIITIVDYDGKKASAEGEFMIGDLLVELTNWSSVIRKGGIYPIDLWVRNMWSRDLQDVYAEVIISKNNEIVSSLRSPSVNMGPFRDSRLNVYWDTRNKNGLYDMEVNLRYTGKVNTKKVEIEVIGLEYNINLILLILIILLLLLDAIWLLRKKKIK